MARKLGEDYFNDMIDRGRREVGGFFYPESNVAQPMYPLRGTSGISKEAACEAEAPKPTFEELYPTGPGRDDPGRDDRGIDRE
jgi:hypothetical protein